MKKLFAVGIVIGTVVYYVAFPFFVANAVGLPLNTDGATTTAGTTDITTQVVQPPLNLVMYMRITAYASVPNETDDTPFVTANGTYVHDGVVASNILPFGTKIEIPAIFGAKVFTVDDRMSPKIKNTIDIWMPNVSKALTFGRQFNDIVIMSMPTSTPQDGENLALISN